MDIFKSILSNVQVRSMGKGTCRTAVCGHGSWGSAGMGPRVCGHGTKWKWDVCFTNERIGCLGMNYCLLKMKNCSRVVGSCQVRMSTCIYNLWVENCKFIQDNKTSIKTKSICVIEIVQISHDKKVYLFKNSWSSKNTLQCYYTSQNKQITTWSTTVFSCVTQHFSVLVERFKNKRTFDFP